MVIIVLPRIDISEVERKYLGKALIIGFMLRSDLVGLDASELR